MRPFGHTSGTLRGIAAFVSLALTAAIFLLLRATSAPRPVRLEAVAVTVFPVAEPGWRGAGAARCPRRRPAFAAQRHPACAARPLRPGPSRSRRSGPSALPRARLSRPRPRALPCGSMQTIGRAIAGSQGTSARWRGSGAGAGRRAPVVRRAADTVPRGCRTAGAERRRQPAFGTDPPVAGHQGKCK
jgi:hypothetical protein